MEERFIELLGQLVNEVAHLRRAVASGSVDKMGFGASPKPVLVHVDNCEYSLWHYFDEEDKKQHITHGSLTGYIVSVEVRPCDGEYVKEKLVVTVKADKTYQIMSNVNSVFSRGFVVCLAATSEEQRSKPLIVAVERGQKNTVFCNLYDPALGVQIDGDWEKHKDKWQSHLKKVLTFYRTNEEKPAPQIEVKNKDIIQPQPSQMQQSNEEIITPIIKITPYNLTQAKGWVKKNLSIELEECDQTQLYSLVRAFCIAALQTQFDSNELAGNSFDNFVGVRLKMGYTLTQSACDWINDNKKNKPQIKVV